jgi:UDP-N-acetylmuramoyl-L-alanyl-D-glutamate--2,6-diaminopimelate ligase
LRLAELLVDYECENMSGRYFLDADILGITADSRQVEPGFLFAALPGMNIDGRDFIAGAIKAGAVAVLAPFGTSLDLLNDLPVSLVPDKNPRRRYAKMAGRFYKPQPRHIAAVTGTNGKSSVVDFTRQLWQACDQPAASSGTLGLVSPGKIEGGSLTTPDPVNLHKILAGLANQGIDHVAVEASSHGLNQFRLDGVCINIAAFTNLSRDHLDYHKTMKEYFAAKLRLFTEVVAPDGIAIINADDEMAEELTLVLVERGIKFFNYGQSANDIILKNVDALPDGQRLYLNVMGRDVELTFPLIGGFQSMNALCALGIVLADGMDAEKAIPALSKLKGVRGRIEFAARSDNGAGIYVDYAHTPDALAHVLTALREHTKNQLKVVFGCGGDRDQGKRPAMGAIAASLADEVIITDDNPRGEDATLIRAQVMSACPGAKEIGDRETAIAVAIDSLSAGDLLVIVGKGHEQGQIIGETIISFDDVTIAKNAAGGVA